MRKYLAFYENEWPANIAELTAVENKPFVGYLKDAEVKFTVVPKPATGPADNEIWYTTSDELPVSLNTGGFNVGILDNVYENGKGVITFDGTITTINEGGFTFLNFETLTFPDTITIFGPRSFMDCSIAQSVTYNGTIDQWNNIDKQMMWNINFSFPIIHCIDGDIIS